MYIIWNICKNVKKLGYKIINFIQVNNFISLSSDSGWRGAGSVLNEQSQQYEWMSRYCQSVHGTTGQELYSSFCPVANIPHSSHH